MYLSGAQAGAKFDRSIIFNSTWIPKCPATPDFSPEDGVRSVDLVVPASYFHPSADATVKPADGMVPTRLYLDSMVL